MAETDVLEPRTVYGASKAAGTLLCTAFAAECGLGLHTVRLFSPYGYWEEPSRLIPSAIAHALRDEDFHMTQGSQGRDFIFVEDVCRVLLLTDFAGLPPGGVYNLGSGRETPVFQAVQLIYELTGSKGEVVRGALASRSHDSTGFLWQADMTRSREALSASEPTPLEEGLSQTITWLATRLDRYEI